MYRLLLVDDEKMVLISVRHSAEWEKFGFTDIFTTTNPQSALHILQSKRIDAACIDIRMPEYTAFNIIEMCKGADIQTTFLILTGYSDFHYAQNAIHLGVFDYLLKPLQPEDSNIYLPKLVAHLWQKRLINDPPLCERLLRGEKLTQLLHWLDIQFSSPYFGLISLRLKTLSSSVFSSLTDVKFTVLLFNAEEAVIFITANTDPTHMVNTFFENLPAPCGASFYMIGQDCQYIPSTLFKARQESSKAYETSIKSLKPVFQIYSYRQTSVSDDTFLMLIHEIENRSHEDLSLSELAEQFNIGYSYCSNLFTQRLGMTFSQYVRQLRMKKAREMLSSTNLSVNMISAQVGYPDYHYFTKVFKKEFGMTPSDFRRDERK